MTKTQTPGTPSAETSNGCPICPHPKADDTWPMFARQPVRGRLATSRKVPALAVQPTPVYTAAKIQVARCTASAIYFGFQHSNIDGNSQYSLASVPLSAATSDVTATWITGYSYGTLLGMALDKRASMGYAIFQNQSAGGPV